MNSDLDFRLGIVRLSLRLASSLDPEALKDVADGVRVLLASLQTSAQAELSDLEKHTLGEQPLESLIPEGSVTTPPTEWPIEEGEVRRYEAAKNVLCALQRLDRLLNERGNDQAVLTAIVCSCVAVRFEPSRIRSEIGARQRLMAGRRGAEATQLAATFRPVADEIWRQHPEWSVKDVARFIIQEHLLPIAEPGESLSPNDPELVTRVAKHIRPPKTTVPNS